MSGESAPVRVNPVWFSWQLHARHSGYHQIVRYLAPAEAGAGPRLSPPARLLRCGMATTLGSDFFANKQPRSRKSFAAPPQSG